MRNIFLITFLIWSVGVKSQHISNVRFSVGNPTSSVRIMGTKPDISLSKIVLNSLNDVSNTQVVNLYFKGCAISNILTGFDTTVQLIAPFPFALRVYTIWDTSATCRFPQLPVLIDSFTASAAQILTTKNVQADAECIKISPNPTYYYMEVSSESEIVSISVYKSTGALVLSKAIGQKVTRVDLTDLPAGPYFIVSKFKSQRVHKSSILKK